MKKKQKQNEEEILKDEIEEEIKPKGVRKFLNILGTILKTIVFSFFTAFLTLILLFIIMAFSIYVSYSKSFATAKVRDNSTQTIFYDKEGGVIYESFGTKEPDKISLSDAPSILKNATLAAEDADFYNHGAVDFRGIGRSVVYNVKSSDKQGVMKLTDLFSEKNYTQGGSTITQQLIKNTYLTNERSFYRKIKEIVYSYEMEKKYSKDQIFEDYLNNVYYGEQSLGIKNAAQNYFGKDYKDLNLAEVSILAGLPQAPTKYSPISGDFNEAKLRQQYVLSKMVERNMITLEQAKVAANEPLDLKPQAGDLVLKHPYFVDFVKQELSSKIGEEAVDRGGLKVYTTLDPKVQDIAEAKAAEYMKKFAYRKVTNTAIVVLDNKNEGIAGMVGGVNWEKSKVNVATSQRQPGSSFKPIVYTAGILSGYSAASRLYDGSVNFGGIPAYRPKNYDGTFHGNVTVRTALANSLNIPAVEMAKLAGIDKILSTAKSMGISTLESDSNKYGLSIGLGSGEVKLFELARAYSVFPNGGEYANFSGISRIVDNEGSEIYSQPKYKSPAIDPRVAYIMTSILSDNQARSMVFGTSSPLTFKDRPVGAKTGTTDDYADSWTMGFTPQYTTGVWMGNNDHSTMAKISGIEGAAYIWHDVMEGIHVGLPVEQFKKPGGLSEAWVNRSTGATSTVQKAPNILEYFLPGTEPKDKPDYSYLNQFLGKK